MLGAINDLFCEYLQREKYDFVDKHGSELFVHVPQVGGNVCTCTSGW